MAILNAYEKVSINVCLLNRALKQKCVNKKFTIDRKMFKILKIIVLLLSFSMFCYQLNTATNSLIDPPTVDSTYERIITDGDIPLVTICPTDQSIERLYGFGYFSVEGLLEGKTLCNKIICYSWGAHHNLTFDKLTRSVFDLEKVNAVQIKGGVYDSVFIPSYS